MKGNIAQVQQPQIPAIRHENVTPPMLVSIALQQGADIDKLSQLMDLAMKWEANEARKSYHLAMSEFKAQDLGIEKDKRVYFKGKDGKPDTEFFHATLGNVVATITPALGKHQLSHSWDVKREGDRVYVTCRLSHAMGHSESITMDGPLDTTGSKNNIQSLGSTVTYLERYTLLAITGLATRDQDNDGAEGTGPVVEYVTPEQLETLHNQASAAGVDMPKFLAFFGIEQLGELPLKRYSEALTAIRAKAKVNAKKEASNVA